VVTDLRDKSKAELRSGEVGDEVGDAERNVEDENTFKDRRWRRGGLVWDRTLGMGILAFVGAWEELMVMVLPEPGAKRLVDESYSAVIGLLGVGGHRVDGDASAAGETGTTGPTRG
jgi:hypothetical protein